MKNMVTKNVEKAARRLCAKTLADVMGLSYRYARERYVNPIPYGQLADEWYEAVHATRKTIFERCKELKDKRYFPAIS